MFFCIEGLFIPLEMHCLDIDFLPYLSILSHCTMIIWSHLNHLVVWPLVIPVFSFFLPHNCLLSLTSTFWNVFIHYIFTQVLFVWVLFCFCFDGFLLLLFVFGFLFILKKYYIIAPGLKFPNSRIAWAFPDLFCTFPISACSYPESHWSPIPSALSAFAIQLAKHKSFSIFLEERFWKMSFKKPQESYLVLTMQKWKSESNIFDPLILITQKQNLIWYSFLIRCMCCAHTCALSLSSLFKHHLNSAWLLLGVVIQVQVCHEANTNWRDCCAECFAAEES